MGRRAVGALLAAAALALVGTAGGAADGDEPPRGFRIDIPDWWQGAPKLAPARAAAEGLEIAARRGWADPSSGCFALVQVLDAPGDAEPAAMLESFEKNLRRLGLTPAPTRGRGEGEDRAGRPGARRLALSSGALRGEVRLLTAPLEGGGLRTASAACFYNRREPAVSEQLCREILSSFEVMP